MVREILSEQIIQVRSVEWEGAREKSVWGRGCVMPVAKKGLTIKEVGKQQNKPGCWREEKEREAAWDEFGGVSRKHGTGSADLEMELGIYSLCREKPWKYLRLGNNIIQYNVVDKHEGWRLSLSPSLSSTIYQLCVALGNYLTSLGSSFLSYRIEVNRFLSHRVVVRTKHI